MADEKDDKGYYNAEQIVIGHNKFEKMGGQLLNIYRGGNDESTMGPDLSFSHNKISNCNTAGDAALIHFTGVQRSNLFSNEFSKSNKSGSLILYKDTVRARHLLENNQLNNSGTINGNQFLTERNNTVE